MKHVQETARNDYCPGRRCLAGVCWDPETFASLLESGFAMLEALEKLTKTRLVCKCRRRVTPPCSEVSTLPSSVLSSWHAAVLCPCTVHTSRAQDFLLCLLEESGGQKTSQSGGN